MTRLQLTVRLFAFTDRSGFAVPRRGAVKVWSAAVDGLVIQHLTPSLLAAAAPASPAPQLTQHTHAHAQQAPLQAPQT